MIVRYTYILLDEVQTVKDFQKVVDSFYVKDNVDIYITGWNAYLLSGRYVEISILPLSFKEFYELNANMSEEDAFSEYLQCGGFPSVATMDSRNGKCGGYLEGINNTVVVKDLKERDNRKHEDKINVR